MLNYDKIQEAAKLSKELHKTQNRKGTDLNYYIHPSEVAAKLITYGANTDQVVGGLLHDVIEDQPDLIGFGEIYKRFGMNVASIVNDCTHEKSGGSYREYKGLAIRRIHDRYLKSNDSYLVIACDKLNNAQSIISDYLIYGDLLFNRFSSSKQDTQWYYMSMCEALNHSAPLSAFEVVNELSKAVEIIKNF